MKFNKCKTILYLVIAIFFTFIISDTLLSSFFIAPYSESYITIEATAKSNAQSFGTDLRLKNIKIDGNEISFDELEQLGDWYDEEGILISLNPSSPASLSFYTKKAKNLELELIQQEGSGIMAIYENGKQLSDVDLYSPNYTEFTFTQRLGRGSLISHWPLLVIISGLLFCLLVFLPNSFNKACGLELFFAACLIGKYYLKDYGNQATLIFIALFSLKFFCVIFPEVRSGGLKALKGTMPALTCACTFSYMLLFYAPLELYFTNQNDFWFDIFTLFPVSLTTFLLIFFLCYLELVCVFFLNKKIYHIYLTVLFSMLIAAYIQGNFLISNLPPLDGSKIDWNQYPTQRILSAVVWVGIFICTIIIAKIKGSQKLHKPIIIASLFIMVILTASLSVVCVIEKGYQKRSVLLATTKNEFEMSTDTNFIILVMDAIDATTFSNALIENPEYQEAFEGFTYYDNTVGAYTYTKCSIPFILSGIWHENKTTYEEYLTDAINNSPLLNSLYKGDYNIGIYDTEMSLSSAEVKNRFENMVIRKSKPTSMIWFAIEAAKLGGIKFAPFEWKQFCYDSPKLFDNLRGATEKVDDPFYKWDNTIFYEAANNENITYTHDKSFKFIHIEGAHVPFKYNKYMQVLENEDGTYEDNVEASMTIASQYLKMLRQSDVYDNSAIIVMADHGYSDVAGWYGRQNPILLIKGIGEKHGFITDHAPISYIDLQEAYQRLLDGKTGDQVFDYRDGDQRERRFLWYRYLFDDHMEEYIQTGWAGDLETMIPTGRVFDLNQN